MPDIKFSCSQCGQHISCDESWAGHQLQCPACQANLIVPQAAAPAPTPAPSPSKPAAAPGPAGRPKLSAGATQVTRPTPTAGVAPRKSLARPPKGENLPLKYGALAVVLIVVGLLAYNYLPGVLNQVQDAAGSKTTGSSTAAPGGGLGPMGEVNGAMDVSDALDGNSSAAARPRPRRQPATNSVGTIPKK